MDKTGVGGEKWRPELYVMKAFCRSKKTECSIFYVEGAKKQSFQKGQDQERREGLKKTNVGGDV